MYLLVWGLIIVLPLLFMVSLAVSRRNEKRL
jgi:hypothetical protein